jgi:hypothetical protein|tara:strand:- start:14 stop:415 length:402 start_codon:yes stop_codon:yes gene_type:complete
MEESYAELVRKSDKFKSDKDKKYKDVSKDRLLKISKKKVQTTMIGALSTIERVFGFLWGHGSQEELTPEQEHMKELFDEVRSEILDRGNNQSRNLEAEFANYEINWLRYQMTLPVKPLNTSEGDKDGQAETAG